MESELRDSSAVLQRGNVAQFEFLLNLYPQALQLKAESKKKKPEELKKFDQWYHNDLSNRIKQRCAKEGTGYLTHEELIQTIKWKLARGKWRPRLKELITMNTPRVVQLETKKAIRQLVKKDDLTSAIQAMCNLKGVGPAMASAVLSATRPESIPYMSDECMLSLPGMSDRNIDYTVAEYLKMVEHVRRASKRLSASGDTRWTSRCVEQVLFSHHVIVHQKPELLQNMPPYSTHSDSENGSAGGAETQQSRANDGSGADSSSNGRTVSSCEQAAAGGLEGEDSRDTATSSSETVNLDNDEATNDSVLSVAGSSSCPTVTEDEDTCADDDTNPPPSHTDSDNTNLPAGGDKAAVANGNGEPICEQDTSSHDEVKNSTDDVTNSKLSTTDEASNEATPTDEAIRVKRAATDDVGDQATPAKCAKTVEIAAGE